MFKRGLLLGVQAGKYSMGIVQYFCYFRWRREGRLLSCTATLF